MHQADTIIFSEMTPAPEWENDFNHWYDHTHIPLRMQCPGFARAQRYQRENGQGYLAIYEMAGEETLNTPEYRKIKEQPDATSHWMLTNVSGFTRYIAQLEDSWGDIDISTPTSAPCLYSVAFNVPPEHTDEFKNWYAQDHVPTLLKEPDWLGVRQFRVLSGTPGPLTHLTLHYLANANALQSPHREVARASSWRARLAEQYWFNPQYAVFNRLGNPHFATGVVKNVSQ